MSSVDKRIVDMQFNNKQFENGVSETTKSLGKLKEGLNLDKSAKSLSNLSDVGRRFSLSNIASSVETISGRFTTLGIIGVTALQNITNSAVNAGKKMLSALTVDPIKTGLQEYETKINAIQTILTNTASKGTQLEDVNRVLAELNTYADKTIYNFAEMTRNIGTFTAAGIELDTAATAIKGIANLAAGSGSSSAQASTAMYQLSQALAAGSVKLQDWNSVVNAGMGGELFQNALLETAKELDGFVKDSAVPFRESLRDGWITAEVLTKTLAKFAEDEMLVKAATQVKTFTQLFDTMKESVQSGWAVSWEYIIGDKDQATSTLTAISDAFNEMTAPAADARNEMLKFWNENGGRDAIIYTISTALKTLGDVIKPIKQAFKDIFPPLTGPILNDISINLSRLIEKFKIGEGTSDKIRRTFRGLFSVLDIGKTIVTQLAGTIGDLLGGFPKLDVDILGTTANLGDMVYAFSESLKTMDIFGGTVEFIVKWFGILKDMVKETSSKVSESLSNIVNSLSEFIDIDLSGLDEFGEKLKGRFEPFTVIGEALTATLGGLIAVLKVVVGAFAFIAKLAGDAFGDFFSSISESFAEADFDKTMDIINGGLLASIVVGLKLFIDKLSKIAETGSGMLGQLTGILDGVKGSLEAYQSQLKAGTLLKIAIAMGILVGSIVALSMIDSTKLATALGAMTVLFTELFGSMGLMNTLLASKGFASMGKVTIGMIGMSTAILLLTAAMKNIADLDYDQISRGLLAIGILAAELAAFMKVADFGGLGVRVGLGLIGLATALLIMSSAVKKMGNIDPATMTKGLAGIAAVLAEVALFAKVTSGSKKIISTSVGLTILGAAMLIFAEAVSKFGSMPLEQIGKGLLAMAGSLAVVTVALNFLPKGMIAKSTGLLLLSVALIKIGEAVQGMGEMSWKSIAKGLITLAGSLGIIAVAMNLMKGTLPGAAALLVVSGALLSLAGVLKLFGSMSWSEIGKGLLTLAGALAIIGVAGLALGPVVPALLGLGASVSLLGIGMLAAGAGLLLFSTGLAALAVSGAAASATIIAIVSGLLGLIPFAFQKIGEGLVAFSAAIEAGTPAIRDALITLVRGLLEAIVTLIPEVVDGLLQLLVTLSETLLEYVPTLIENGFELLQAILQGVRDNIKDIVQTGIDIILAFIDGVISRIPEVIDAAYRIIITFIDGLAEAIENNAYALIQAVKRLFFAVMDAIFLIIKEAGTPLFNAGKELLMEFVNAIKNAIIWIKEGITEIIDNIIQWFKDAGSSFVQIGKDIVNGIIDGVKNMASAAVDAVKDLGKSILDGAKGVLGINSPSKEFKQIGKWSGEGMIEGLKVMGRKVYDAGKLLGSEALDSVKGVMSNIADKLSSGIDSRPVIAPVLDMSNIKSGMKSLNNMDGRIKIGTSYNKANQISNDIIDNLDDPNGKPGAGGTSYTFNQTNVSPKALNRSEIYRQTNNQFAKMKGVTI